MTVRIAIDGKAVGGVMNGEYGDTEEPSKRADAFLGCRAGEAALEGAGGFFGRLQDEVRVALVRGTEARLKWVAYRKENSRARVTMTPTPAIHNPIVAA